MSQLEANISGDLQHSYPQLRELLLIVYTSTLEPAANDGTVTHRTRGHSTREARQGIQSRKGRHIQRRLPWSQQRGFQNGLSTLRKLRDEDHTHGKALQVFSELVIQSTPNLNMR